MNLKQKLFNALSEVNQLEIAKKGFVYIVMRVFGLLLGYGFTLIVTHEFGSPVYGLVVLGLTVFTIFSIAGKYGYDIVLTRFVASQEYSKVEIGALLGRASAKSFGVSLVLCLPLILFREWIAVNLLQKPMFASYLLWSALAIPFWSQILIHIGLYRGLRMNSLYSFYNAFSRFFVTVLLLLLAIALQTGRDGEVVVVVHFTGVFVLYLSCCYVTYGRLGYPVWHYDNGSWKSFTRTARPIFFTSLIFILLSWIDRFFVGYYRDEQSVAIYDVAAKLALLVSFNLDAINSILAPKVVGLFQRKDQVQLQDMVTFSANLSGVISLVTFAGLLIFHPFLLEFFGPEYQQGTWVLAILAVSQLTNCLSGSVGILLQMTGHQDIYKRIMIGGLLVNLSLNILLAPLFGIEGVAIATFAGMLTWNLMGMYYCRAKLNLISFVRLKALKKRNKK